MEKIGKHDRFYFTNDRTFRNPHDNIHFFLMDNYSIGMHKQEFFEINIITRGRGTHYIGENALQAETGDVFIIPPEVEHGYKGGQGFDVYHILINNKYIQKNFSELRSISGFSMLFNVEPVIRARLGSPLHLKLTVEQLRDIEPMLSDRKGQQLFVSTEDAFINIGAFLITVTKLCQFYVRNTSALREESEVQDASFMQALAMIHERYNEKLTVEALAREARMSKSTFMRRFLYICKCPPAEYITKTRIEVAENLLLNSNFSISEIAEKAGFYDTSHFSKTFVKYHDCPPLEYRKRTVKER